MAIDKKNFPVVLAIIENFGLSSSWTGNAIASANPVNFYTMWKNNPHTLLYPNKINHTSSYENSEIDTTRLFSGREILCDKEYLDQVIKNNELIDNQILNNIFKEAEEHNSALHLIGNLPGANDQYADLNHLLSLIETIKNKQIFRVYLHLIIDDNAGENPEIIEEFLTKIKEIGVCEIASVIGKKYISDTSNYSRNFIKAINTIVLGEGDKALTPEQALSFKNLPKSSDKRPTSVLFNNRFACRIGNFDTILFFNHNNKSLSKLALALTSGSSFSIREKFPKFLTIVSMFDSLDYDLEGLEVLFSRNFSETLTQSLFSENIDQLYLSDTSRVSVIKKSIEGQITGSGGLVKELFVPIVQDSNFSSYDQVLSLMLRQVSIYLEQKKFRFITLLIPVLSMPNITTFAEMVKAITMIDDFLPKLEAEVSKHNGILVLTSNHGGVEKMSQRNNFETKNSKTNNPVPFVLSIPGYKGAKENNEETSSNRMLYDMIKKSHFIGDFAPTILDLFHAKVPSVMTGKSILSELKAEIKEE